MVAELELVVVTTTDWRGVSQEEGGANALEQATLEVIIDQVVPAAH